MAFYRSEAMDILFDEATLRERVAEMGRQITQDYGDADADGLVVVGVLKGSFIFLADLCRAIDLPVEVDFLGLSSYGDQQESTGVVRVTQDLSRSVERKHVLVVEDIVDTGPTMKYLIENLSTRNPESVRVATLLHKPARSQVDVPIDYLGFEIPDRFVVGYGLDYASKLRNLPFIGVVTGDVMPV